MGDLRTLLTQPGWLVFKELLYTRLTELTMEVSGKDTQEETWEARNVAEGFEMAIGVAERISSREELGNVERERKARGIASGLRKRGRFGGRDRGSGGDSGGGLKRHPYSGTSG